MMDHILQRTESKKLFYICHSQGCTELFVLLALRPEYNKKIQLAVNLAPAVFMEHLSGISGLGSPFSHIGSVIYLAIKLTIISMFSIFFKVFFFVTSF